MKYNKAWDIIIMSHALYFKPVYLFIWRNANSVLLQKRDIDLLKTVAEAKIVIRRLIDERNDAQVWEALFDKACEIAL